MYSSPLRAKDTRREPVFFVLSSEPVWLIILHQTGALARPSAPVSCYQELLSTAQISVPPTKTSWQRCQKQCAHIRQGQRSLPQPLTWYCLRTPLTISVDCLSTLSVTAWATA